MNRRVWQVCATWCVVAAASRARAEPFSYGDPDAWWLDPLSRAALTVAAVSEDDRPYSTPVRPRDIAGFVGLSCEHQEGRPCGNGVGTYGELDSEAGYRDLAEAFVRLRAVTGSDRYASDLQVDRAYVAANLGPFQLEGGRDVLVVGPEGARTQLAWGDNSAPLDHVRASTRPLAITEAIHGELYYAVGVLRDPQTYPNDLVTIARGQLELGADARTTIGMMQMLQLEGDGAPHLGFWDFIEEHFTRKDASASATDSSNRRVGFDVSTKIDGFGGARLYYQIVFEDWRKQFADAIRYDADHLAGIHAPARHDFRLELLKTGVRSQEHSPRVTGFTNADRVVGAPLGPDAESIFASVRLGTPWGSVSPWAELARLGSDTYEFIDHGPILHIGEGTAEWRYRAGAHTIVPVRPDLHVDADTWLEHVEHFAFDPAARRENVGVVVSIVWHP